MSTLTMPLSAPFNILAYLDRLKEAGMPDAQATAHAEAMQTLIQANGEEIRKISESTARDTVNSMRSELRNELATKGDLRETELRLQKEIEASKHEMIKWYIGMTVALTGVFVGILAAFYAIMR